MNPKDPKDRFYFVPAYFVPACGKCVHYRGYSDGTLKCDAFPEKIPLEMLDSPEPPASCNGKDDIHFEPMPSK